MSNLEKIQYDSYGIKVWRVIKVESLEHLNIDTVGGSWSYNQKAAHSWYGGEGDPLLLEGSIPFECINLEVTLRQNLVNPDEKEFRLYSDSPIWVHKIMNQDQEVIKEFTDPICSSAGVIGSIGNWEG